MHGHMSVKFICRQMFVQQFKNIGTSELALFTSLASSHQIWLFVKITKKYMRQICSTRQSVCQKGMSPPPPTRCNV